MISTAEMRKIAEKATTNRVDLDHDAEQIDEQIAKLQLQIQSLQAAKAEVEFDARLAAEAEWHAWEAVSDAEGIDYNNRTAHLDY